MRDCLCQDIFNIYITDRRGYTQLNRGFSKTEKLTYVFAEVHTAITDHTRPPGQKVWTKS